MQIELFSDIPLPQADVGRAQKYPLAQMEVGQSFFVVLEDGAAPKSVIARLSGSIQRYRAAGHKDQRFSVRAVPHPQTAEPAVGVWRTE